METDGRLGLKVEHHKCGDGQYVSQYSGNVNDGKVKEKMNGHTIREKEGQGDSQRRVERSYRESSGSYSLFADNCQHASDKAYRESTDDECAVM